MAGIPVSIIVQGHDGGEYLAYAAAFAYPGTAVPADALRHSPGWPLLLAPAQWTPVPPLAGAVLSALLLTALLILYDRMLRAHVRLKPHHRLRLVAALAVFYPPAVYYGCFLLSESAYLALMLLAFLTLGSGARPHTYALAAAAALTRGAGIVLAPALAVGAFLRAPRLATVLTALIAPLLVLVGTYAARYAFGTSAAEAHRAVFSWPFRGLPELFSDSPARVAFTLAATAAVSGGAIAFMLPATRRRCTEPFHTGAALYAGTYLLFHFSLYRLRYYGADIPTFRYMDRYLIGVLPLVLIPAARLLAPPVLLAGAAASAALSAWWGLNYLRAAGPG